MIERKSVGVELYDVMMNSRWETKVHEHGLVALVDVMPRLVPQGQTVDSAIVQAARVSYGEGTKTISDDRGLIRYLMRHRHTTPLEHCEFKFHCVMPIFVARQWIRHRTANVNEYSARYSIVKDRFYRPPVDGVREQSNKNKQGGDLAVDESTAAAFLQWLECQEREYQTYENFVQGGVSRELARIGLPASVYTEWYWKIDLHNLFHFLSLRMDSHAQQEIRDYANAMFAIVQELAPIASQAFLDYNFEALRLSGPEVEAIRSGNYFDAFTNKREQEEFQVKLRRLGL